LKIHFLVVALVSVWWIGFESVIAQNAPKYSNEFLTIGVGARALGMSNAVVASSSDVHAGYWNPAGLTQLQREVNQPKFQVGLMHNSYFAGLANYDYLGTAIPTDVGVVGISVIRMGIDDIQNTINLRDQNTGQFDYSRITKFSTADYGILLSFARKSKIEGLSLGGNVKIIHRIIGDFAQAWGFGLDVGAQYRKKDWKFGAVLRDATSTFNAWSFTLDRTTQDVFLATSNELPENGMEITLPRLALGGGYTFYFLQDQLTASPEVNATFTFDGQRNAIITSDPVSIDPSLGVEFGFRDIVFLRGGIGNLQQVKAEVGDYKTTSFQPNFGVGLQLADLFGLGTLSVDYALTDIGDQTLLYSNVFSLRFDLNTVMK